MATTEDRRSTAWAADLARFAAGFTLEAAPAGVVDQAKLCVLDTIGCIANGAADEGVGQLIAAEKEIDPREIVPIPGLAGKFAPEAAARIGAYMGDVYEWNDLVGGHASIACLPAAMALGFPAARTGRDLLEAFIVGAEITGAIYEASSVSPSADSTTNYRKDFHDVSVSPVTIPSSVGAAATASRILGLDAKQTEHALNIAVVLGAFAPSEGIFGAAGSAKPLLFGPWPAFIGMRAAVYAKAGMTGATHAMESPIGYFSTVSIKGHPAPVAGGDFWRLSNPRRKYHANCGFMHSAIDTLAAMRRDGVDFAGASAIRIGVPQDVWTLTSKTDLPSRAGETMFHAEYNLALAALEVDRFEPRHSLEFQRYLADPAFRDIYGKLSTFVDPELVHSICSTVTVIAKDGSIAAERRYDEPKGSYANPMTRAEVEDKFRLATAALIDESDANDFIGRVSGLDEEKECTWLATSFQRRNASS